MKKGRLKKFLAGTAIGLCALAMPFGLVGCDKEEDINVRFQDNYFQWQVEGDSEWNNLLTIEEIKDLLGEGYKGDTGATGAQGQQGVPGIDGREVEFRTNATHIQWRYVEDNQGEDDGWENLVELETIKGTDGNNGSNGSNGTDGITPHIGINGNWWIGNSDTGVKAKGDDGTKWYSGEGVPKNQSFSNINFGDFYLDKNTLDVYKYDGTVEWEKFLNLNSKTEKENVIVNFDANLPAYMYEFEDYIVSNSRLQATTIDKGSWISLENFKETELEEYFLGWFVGEGIDETKITSFTSINTNCTLRAKWDYEKIDLIYTSAGVQLIESVALLSSECGEVVHIANYAKNGKEIKTVAGFDLAKNTIEILLPGGANVSYNNSTDATPNTKLEKVSWFGISSATKIDDYSFYPCTKLCEITIPNSILEVGKNAFMGCDSLTEIIFKGTQEEWESIDIDESNTKLLDGTITIKFEPIEE